MRVRIFATMLQQMAIHFTVSQVQRCVFVWENATHIGFMLLMENGEYWYVTNLGLLGFELFKYPPPIPALSDLAQNKLMPAETVAVQTMPVDINSYITEVGGGGSTFLVEH